MLKDEKDAISELVTWQIHKTQNQLNKRNSNEDTIIEELVRIKSCEDNNVDEEAENEEIEQVL